MPRKEFLHTVPLHFADKARKEKLPNLGRCLVSMVLFKKGDIIHYSHFGLARYFGKNYIYTNDEHIALFKYIAMRSENFCQKIGTNLTSGCPEDDDEEHELVEEAAASSNRSVIETKYHYGNYINHSSEYNCAMVNEEYWVALKDILPGEKITTDYCVSEPFLRFTMDCHCGTKSCRKQFSSRDWKLPLAQPILFEHMREKLKYQQILSNQLPQESNSKKKKQLVIVIDEQHEYSMHASNSLAAYLYVHDAISFHIALEPSNKLNARRITEHYYKYLYYSGPKSLAEFHSEIKATMDKWSSDSSSSAVELSMVNYNSQSPVAQEIEQYLVSHLEIPAKKVVKSVPTTLLNDDDSRKQVTVHDKKVRSTLLHNSSNAPLPHSNTATQEFAFDSELECEMFNEMFGLAQNKLLANQLLGIQDDKQADPSSLLNGHGALVSIYAEEDGLVWYCALPRVLAALPSLYDVYWHVSHFETVKEGQKLVTFFLQSEDVNQVKKQIAIIHKYANIGWSNTTNCIEI